MTQVLLFAAMAGMLASFVLVASVALLAITRSRKGAQSSDKSPEYSGTNSPGGWIDTNVTFFNDKSGFSGVDLFEYGKKSISFNNHKLYPCAVHHDDAADFLWSVVEVEGSDLKRVYLHVLDICNRADAPCTNRDKNGRKFLIDVHQTGWSAIGKTTGVLEGRVRKIGRIGASELPVDVFLKGKDTYVMCSCTGDCSRPLQNWKPIETCKN